MDKENWRADREACCVKLYDSPPWIAGNCHNSSCWNAISSATKRWFYFRSDTYMRSPWGMMWVNITLTLSFTFNRRVTSRNALKRNDFNESQDFNKANLIKNLYVVIFMYRTRSCRDRNAHKSSRVKKLYISNASNIVTIVSYLLLFNFLKWRKSNK